MLITDLSQITDPSSIISYWNDQQRLNPPYWLAPTLLTSQEIQGDTTSQYYGTSSTPSGLSLSADDTLPPRDKENDGFSDDSFRLIPFSNSKMFDERRMNAIRNALALHQNDPGFVDALGKSTMDSSKTLLDRASFTKEKLTFDAILNNGIHINDGRLQRDINYHAQPWQEITVDQPWGTKDAHPITNLQDAVKYMNDHHNNVTETIAIMNSHTRDELYKSGQIVNTLTPTHSNGDLNVALNTNAVSALVTGDTNLHFYVYDKGDANGRFIPDGKVILLPTLKVGRMAWTQTNEALGLTNSQSAKIQNTGDGVTVMTYRQLEPVGTIMVVSMRCLPVIDQEPNILIMDVDQGGSSKGNPYTVMPTDQSSNGGASNGNGSSSNNGSSKSGSKSSKKSNS